MDAQHLNTYIKLIESLLQCTKGKEWFLLQKHEDLINSELLTVMEQVASQLNSEGNATAAQFLHYWVVQLNHLLQQQNNTSEFLSNKRSESYLQLIQTLLDCSKGDEMTILNQNPGLMDETLVYMMNQVAAQLAAKGDQDAAIYLKHLAADVNQIWLYSSQEQMPISSPLPDELLVESIEREIADSNKQHYDEKKSPSSDAPQMIVTDLAPVSSPLSNSHTEELLEKISMRLDKLEILLRKYSAPLNPLWYMPILEQVDAHDWIISSEEVELLIGTKPSCATGHNSFVRGCWKFIKVGKVGTHSSWRVIKEIEVLPADNASILETPILETPILEADKLEPVLSSPWS
jgi:hypothetical protein